MFNNPGMAQMYEATFTPQQAEQFREKVRAAYHAKWPASDDTSLLANPYMMANAATASVSQ
jgi:hypothetical protein